MTGYITRAFNRIASWLPSADEEVPPVDEEYVRESQQFQSYWFVDVVERDGVDGVRCNLCGQLFQLEEAPAALGHVADHDRDGAASIDPFHRGFKAAPLTSEGLQEKRRRPATESTGAIEIATAAPALEETTVIADGIYEWIREDGLTASDLRERESGPGPGVWDGETLAELDDDRLPAGFWANGGEK